MGRAVRSILSSTELKVLEEALAPKSIVLPEPVEDTSVEQEDSLPEGWTKHPDASSGLMYFVRTHPDGVEESHWEHPSPGPLADGWSCSVRTTGEKFYENATTGEVKYGRPPLHMEAAASIRYQISQPVESSPGPPPPVPVQARPIEEQIKLLPK